MIYLEDLLTICGGACNQNKIPIDTNNIVSKAISLFRCLIETKHHE